MSHFGGEKGAFRRKPHAPAHRHFLPYHIWHITHRCHKKEFLLKFARDRRRWMYWLHEAVRVMAKTQLGKGLSEGEVADMVAFLEALRGTYPEQTMPRLPPTPGDLLM